MSTSKDPKAPPASPTRKPDVVVNDSVRKDGGKPTDDQPVTPEQRKELGHTAVEHTADEAGS